MIWLFTRPYPELQSALEASGQTVVVKDRYVVGRRYVDEIEYPYRAIIDEIKPGAIVFPDLWDGSYGYARVPFAKWRGLSKAVFVTCQYRTDLKLPTNCRAAATDGHVGLYQDEAQANAHAANSRAVLWQHDEPITPLLAAVRDVRLGNTYKALNSARHPYRNP